MVTKVTQGLSEDEAELYDRQIRLWGVECQQKLRSASILLIGISGIGAEVAKNLVLSGIHTLTVIDNKPFSEADQSAQFLAPHEVGKNRAAASYDRLKALNPRVNIVIDETDVNMKPDDFFTENHSVVIATGLDLPALIRIDELCKAKQRQFFATDVFGMYGFMFINLHNHKYVKESLKFISKGVTEAVLSEKTIDDMTPIKETFGLNPNSQEWKTRLPKIDVTYIIASVLLKFRTKMGRDISPHSREKDLELCKSILQDEFEVPEDMVSPQLFGSAFYQANPVCAIVGATVSQEVVKVVSGKGQPVQNVFLFNPLTSTGLIENI